MTTKPASEVQVGDTVVRWDGEASKVIATMSEAGRGEDYPAFVGIKTEATPHAYDCQSPDTEIEVV